MTEITTPFTREQADRLRAGDSVLFTGTLYTARDAAHARDVYKRQPPSTAPPSTRFMS